MVKATKTRNAETAPVAYTRLTREINAQIRNLEFRLQIHEGIHRDHPSNWGYPGDLGHVKEILANAIEFLGSGK